MRAPRGRPGGRHPAAVQPGDSVAGARARVPMRFRGDGRAAFRTAARAGRPAGEQEEARRDRTKTPATADSGG